MFRVLGKQILKRPFGLLSYTEQTTCSSLVIHKKYGTKTLKYNVSSLSEAGDVKLPSQYQDPNFDYKKVTFSPEDVEKLLKQMESDEPLLTMEDPYAAKPRRCILCKYNVDIDYKNAQLLSQFVSPHTGRIYGRRVTGLCIPMQKRIAKLIKRARIFAFMPYLNKDVEFYEDDKLVEYNKPSQKHF
ncbi:hypothetical protein LOTGIDRAFT_231695 [Lottia gigantea]|uniref:28S ribosomal protein S18c, mitochondrial n=1 Tax=Lottia gigantea TaxID=225164 RepID=V4AQ27_LOTGI|nr:hypothetical protein LOTGIDRAFT_231695 [Lottia gigantea]ESO96880.1 hypothetical protein LOTGIDRAFT_231695 [Lottia gigantea]